MKKEKCKEIYKKTDVFVRKHPAQIILALLLLVSLLINIIFWSQHTYLICNKTLGFKNQNIQKSFIHKQFQKIDSRNGMKKEFYKKCVNGVCTSKEKESKLSEKDIAEIKAFLKKEHEHIRREIDYMNRIFEEQEKYFNAF